MMWLTMFSLSPDPTLTVGSVTRTMGKVTVDKRRRVWEKVLGEEAVEEIYSSHSSEEEKLSSCADIYVTCQYDPSWEHLVQKLYNCIEMVAAKEAKVFLQETGSCLILYIVHLLSGAHSVILFIKVASKLEFCLPLVSNIYDQLASLLTPSDYLCLVGVLHRHLLNLWPSLIWTRAL